MTSKPSLNGSYRRSRGCLRRSLVAALMLGAVMVGAGSTPTDVVEAGPPTSSYVPVTPARVVDTRSGAAIAANTTHDFKMTGSLVPESANAVVINVTATRSQGNGYVEVFPTGRSAVGSSSTLNVDFAGQTIPNAAFAPLGDGGKITVFTTFTTDILIDVFGYFVPAETATAGRFVPLIPSRILDSRNNIGYTSPTSTPPGLPAIGGGQVVPLQVSGRGGVPPSGASAVVMNVTAVAPNRYGYIEVTSTTDPGYTKVSNLNVEPGRTIANLVVIPLGDAGQVGIRTVLMGIGAFDGFGRLDLLADVVGYFTDSTAPSSTTGLFVPLTPTRNIDTRQPPPKPEIAAEDTISLDATKIPASASAITGNLTSTGGSAGGYLQLPSTPGSPGTSSSLNTSYEGQTIANAVVTPVADGRNTQVYTYGSTHILLDVTGWFTGAT